MTDDYKVVRSIMMDLEIQVEKILDSFPVRLAEAEPELYYMNGNDGTDFDWQVNNRICEFMAFYPSGHGAVKAMLYKNGDLDLYAYDVGAMSPFKQWEHKNRYVKEAVETMAEFLFDNLDCNYVWDERVCVADLDDSDYTEWHNEHYMNTI